MLPHSLIRETPNYLWCKQWMPRIRNVGRARPQPVFVVPVISNVVTNGNSTGTKNALRNRALGFVFSIQSSVYGAITVAKISPFPTWIRSTVICKRRNRIKTIVILWGLLEVDACEHGLESNHM